MIQKTDLMILVIATAGLSVGIFRWYENTQNVSAVTIPASSTVVIPAPEMPPEPTNMTVVSVSTNASSSKAEATVAAQIEQTHSTQPVQNEFMEYVVRSGDVLSRIAVRYNTDVATLQRLNRISGTAIYPGQTLIYPVSVN